jgi:type IV pilus assembly protein PilW
MMTQTIKHLFSPRPMNQKGFTLIELVITMAVTAVVGGAVLTNYISQQRSSTIVREVARMQQNLRGAIYMLEQDIHMAGYDPEEAGLFGFTDISRWKITETLADASAEKSSSPSLSVSHDWNPFSAATTDNGLLDDEDIPSYRLCDDGADGITDLCRDVDNDRQVVAEGIEAIGFAYAFDNDGDGQLDRTAGGNIIWAVDSDNDNRLDTNLDNNDDGLIDLGDDKNGDNTITGVDGGTLATSVPMESIRSVRIWLLARGGVDANRFVNTAQYVVGDQVVPAAPDNFRRRMLVRTVQCRNLGL